MKTLVPLLLLLASTPAAQAPVTLTPVDPRLTQAVESHIRWLGGRDALVRLRSVDLCGAVESDPMEGKARIAATRAGHVRRDLDLGAIRETALVGPDGAFKVNLSGQVEPLPEGERARLAALGARLLGRVWTGDPAVQLELRADEEREAKTYRVVRVRCGEQAAFDAFLGDEGNLDWLREDAPPAGTIWTHLTDWRSVQGLRFPFAEETDRSDTGGPARVTWEKVEPDGDLPPALFARPTATASLASFAGDAQGTGWLPMTLHLGRYIYLRGTLNGHATDIVLDSGAGATVVDAGLADELALPSEGAVQARGVGGTQQASFLAGVSIGVGNLTLRGIRAVKLDLAPLTPMLGRTMPVILGKEAFHATVIDIDYPASRIAFRDPATYHYEGEGHTVELVPGGDGHRHVEVVLEDGLRGLCTVDTGSGGTLAVFQAFVDRHDLLAGRAPISASQSGGVGGRIVSKLATLRSVTFAGYELRDVPATFGADKRGGAFDDDALLGNLGAGIFGRFRLVFDYRRDALHVEPGPDHDTTAFRRDHLGLSGGWQDDGCVVSFVAPGSPAAAAGIEAGARLAAISDTKLVAATWRQTMLDATQSAPGTKVTVTLADGRRIELRAARFY